MKKLSWAVWISSLLGLLTACDQSSRYEKDITKSFLDPSAAQFRNTRTVNLYSEAGSRVRAYCGELNAKNAVGGYTGFRRFLHIVDRTDSAYVQNKWPDRAIYKVGDTIYADGNLPVYRQYCDLPEGRRTDDELWINE